VNEVVSAVTLRESVVTLAEKICANAPIAVQTAKQLVAHPSAAILESLASAANAFTDDAKEGIASFRERRSPQFKGH
jgi:1,4-dihydroxy-2-naphthoyl-CoA synthase